jgi:hypothetical protein
VALETFSRFSLTQLRYRIADSSSIRVTVNDFGSWLGRVRDLNAGTPPHGSSNAAYRLVGALIGTPFTESR